MYRAHSRWRSLSFMPIFLSITMKYIYSLAPHLSSHPIKTFLSLSSSTILSINILGVCWMFQPFLRITNPKKFVLFLSNVEIECLAVLPFSKLFHLLFFPLISKYLNMPLLLFNTNKASCGQLLRKSRFAIKCFAKVLLDFAKKNVLKRGQLEK